MFVVFFIVLYSFKPVLAQQRVYQNSYLYVGLNVNLLSIATKIDYATLFSFKLGYQHKLNELFSAGPHVEVLFARHPKDRKAKPSIYMGPSIKLETSRLYADYSTIKDFPDLTISNAFFYLMPVKPAVLNYDYHKLYRFSTIFRTSHIANYELLMGLNLDFQEYDRGIVSEDRGSLTLGIGSSYAF